MGIFLLVLKGLSGIFIQSIILREIFSTFFGNEFSFSFFISFYLLGGATGSYFFKNSKNYKTKYISFTILEIFFLIFFLIFFRFSISKTFYISNLKFFIFSFFISFFSGFFEGSRFILLSFIYRGEKSSAKVYGYEAGGFLIGGVLFPLFLILKIDLFFLVFLLSIINILTVIYFNKKFSLFLLILILLLPFSKKIEFKTTQMKYKGFFIEEIKETFYNKLIILKKENQKLLVSNGFQEISSQPDYFSIKNISFFSLYFDKKTEKIGVIGNPELVEELKKYNIGQIYFFELDKEKINLLKEYFLKNQYKNLIFVNKDIKKFASENKIKFDTLIITNSLPLSFKDNYFLTDEFFKEISKFTENLLIVMPGTYDYFGIQIINIHSSIYKTLKKYFKNDVFVFTYPLIFVFSNNQIQENKSFSYDKEFFNENYLNFVLDKSKKNEYIKRVFIKDVPINTISNQFCLYYSIFYHFSQTSQKVGNIIEKLFSKLFKLRDFLLLIFLLIFLIFLLIPISSYSEIIFTNGFVCLTFETIFILLFQISYGFFYGFMSAIFGIFMAGISIGSLISVLKIPDKKMLFISEVFHFLFYIFAYFLLINLKLPFFLIFFSGFLTGLEFGIISFLQREKNIVHTTGKFYSIDLVGALFSSLFFALFLIPTFGLYTLLLLIPLLKFSNLFKLSISENFFK
ncbi:MAG: hypothetical protein NC915_04945 [Candidatus Omnitrophica bacterium]|nr:hypothetical protein [Candidatus Omnitrophota bacterium]